MIHFAVLLACFNRKQKTVSCLSALYCALDLSKSDVSVEVFLTDDGTDGTGQLIKSKFPERNIQILNGTGKMYWAGGMRNSWKNALQTGGFDGYIWLNDDTVVFRDLFEKIISADAYCKNRFQIGGVYIGSTCDNAKSRCTYGGIKFTNKFFNTYLTLSPKDEYQDCDMGNGNIVYVSDDVVKKIGLFHNGYTHGCADFGYTLLTKRKKLPLFVLPGFIGLCENNNYKKYQDFKRLKFQDRVKYLYSPLGLQFSGYLLYQREFFPYRYPFVLLVGLYKVLFPGGYTWLSSRRLRFKL